MKKRVQKLQSLLLVALVAVGFLSNLSQPQSNLRKISSAQCADPSVPVSAPAVSIPQFPTGLFSFIQDNTLRQNAMMYSLFLRQAELNASMFSFSAPSMWGLPMPSFPSYAIPSISSYQVSFAKPDSSHQIFGGLMADPQLQYLIKPATASSASAPAPGSLNAAVATTLAFNPSRNVGISLEPAAKPVDPPTSVSGAGLNISRLR